MNAQIILHVVWYLIKHSHFSIFFPIVESLTHRLLISINSFLLSSLQSRMEASFGPTFSAVAAGAKGETQIIFCNTNFPFLNAFSSPEFYLAISVVICLVNLPCFAFSRRVQQLQAA